MGVQPKTVVIIDDSPTVRFVLKKDFAEMNYVTIGLAEGKQSAKILLSNLKTKNISPEIITVDLIIPGVIGDELIRLIRMLHPKSIVVVITGFEYNEIQAGYEDLDSDFFFVKPIQKEQLQFVCSTI